MVSYIFFYWYNLKDASKFDICSTDVTFYVEIVLESKSLVYNRKKKRVWTLSNGVIRWLKSTLSKQYSEFSITLEISQTPASMIYFPHFHSKHSIDIRSYSILEQTLLHFYFILFRSTSWPNAISVRCFFYGFFDARTLVKLKQPLIATNFRACLSLPQLSSSSLLNNRYKTF